MKGSDSYKSIKINIINKQTTVCYIFIYRGYPIRDSSRITLPNNTV